jgi:hypothetical protein
MIEYEDEDTEERQRLHEEGRRCGGVDHEETRYIAWTMMRSGGGMVGRTGKGRDGAAAVWWRGRGKSCR